MLLLYAYHLRITNPSFPTFLERHLCSDLGTDWVVVAGRTAASPRPAAPAPSPGAPPAPPPSPGSQQTTSAAMPPTPIGAGPRRFATATVGWN